MLCNEVQPLALPLGELSPKVTDTEIQLKPFLKILIEFQYEYVVFYKRCEQIWTNMGNLAYGKIVNLWYNKS